MSTRGHNRRHPDSRAGKSTGLRSRLCRLTSALAALMIGLLLLRCNAIAQSAPPLEFQVKAAFLLNFTKFADWPADAFAGERAPLTICILGEDPFGPTLDQMVQGEEVSGRHVTVQRIRGVAAPKTCQVLYLRSSERELRQILASMPPGTLTVGEGDGFLSQGGMIAFVIENRRVRFDVNQGAASEAGLTLSSRLLSVARSVTNRSPRP